jgi:hypothetical protein
MPVLALIVIDTVTAEAVEPGGEVHGSDWSGTLNSVTVSGLVRVTERSGETRTWPAAMFNLTVDAIAMCGCTVTNGNRVRAPWCLD